MTRSPGGGGGGGWGGGVQRLSDFQKVNVDERPKCVCVRACVRACVCVRECVRVCVLKTFLWLDHLVVVRALLLLAGKFV